LTRVECVAPEDGDEELAVMVDVAAAAAVEAVVVVVVVGVVLWLSEDCDRCTAKG
jgi:hypothetical protein